LQISPNQLNSTINLRGEYNLANSYVLGEVDEGINRERDYHPIQFYKH